MTGCQNDSVKKTEDEKRLLGAKITEHQSDTKISQILNATRKVLWIIVCLVLYNT